MKTYSQEYAQFTISSSRNLLAALSVLHVFSILACLFNELPLPARMAFAIFVSISWYYQYKTCKNAHACLVYSQAKGWSLSYDDENFFDVKIKPTTVMGRGIIVLHFDVGNRSKALVICNDAMQANAYRGLLVLLKISQ